MEGRGCLCKSLVSILILCFSLITTTSVHGQGTRVSFYSSTCPRAEDLVRSTVESHFQSNPAIAPGILRIHFHDCLVRGCDGSVLIDGPNTEKSTPQNSGTRGYDVIDAAKTQLETTCSGVVSCADILALAERDAVVLETGFSWQVPTGRRDERVSLASEACTLPHFNDSIDSQKQQFATKGLNTQDLIAQVGGHTIGTTSCGLFSYRLYSLNFKVEFAKSMEKMSNIGVKTGTQGEIRRVCTAVN